MVAGGVLAVLVSASFGFAITAIGDLRRSHRLAAHSEEAILQARRSEKLAVDLETGVRGFLLTDQERFLQPFVQGLAPARALAAQLERLVRDNPRQRATAAALRRALDSYIEDYARPVVAEERRTDLPPRRDLAVTAESKRRLDGIRAGFDRFVAHETMRARARQSEADSQADRAVIFGWIGLLGSILLVMAYTAYLTNSVLFPLRRIAAGARRLARGELGARVPEQAPGEVGELGRTFNAMAASLQQNRDVLETQNAELEEKQHELARVLDQVATEKTSVERLQRFGERLAQETELRPLAQTILWGLCELAGAQAGVLYAGETGGPPALAATRGVPAERLPATLQVDDGLAGAALAERARVVSSHGETGMRMTAFGEQVRLHQEVHLPLSASGRTVGVVSLARVQDVPFDPAELDMLEHLAGQSALAVTGALSLEASRRAARLNKAVLDTASDAFVSVSEAGRVREWNPRAEAIFGWTSEEVSGRDVTGLLIPPRHRERWQTAFAGMARGGEEGWLNRPREMQALRRDGREVPVELTISSLELGGVRVFNAFIRDISARKRGERHFGIQHAVTEALAEIPGLEEAIPRLLEVLGSGLDWRLGSFWLVGEATGELRLAGTWHDPTTVRAAALEAVRRRKSFNKGEGLPGRVWADEEVTWVKDVADGDSSPRIRAAAELDLTTAIGVPIRSGGRVIAVLEFYDRDIGQPDESLIALMGYISQLIGQFVERKEAERQAERLKDEFFALVSHELRTPLTSIIGYLELVLEDEGGLDADQRRFLSVVERNSRRLLRLVGDLLFVAQVEAGSLALERGSVELDALAREAVEAARPRAEDNGVTLQHELDPLPPLTGDRDRLAQVFDNLISNALKFTPAGGHVVVRVTSAGHVGVTEVRDTGMGIAAAEQERLFDRFFRSTTATEQAIPGVGLGLTIVKAVVEAHGGTISVSSQEGAGTTFRIELPLSAPADGSAAAPGVGTPGAAPEVPR